MSKDSYIEHKHNNIGIKPGEKGKTFNESWWNGISTLNVPVCSKCIEDNNNFSLLGKTMTVKEFEKSDKIKCCPACFWFEWSQRQRENISKYFK